MISTFEVTSIDIHDANIAFEMGMNKTSDPTINTRDEEQHIMNTKISEVMKETTSTKSRIAFGSCNDQKMKNNLWNVIESRNPAAFIWGGDAIYADVHGPKNWSTFPPSSNPICATPSRLRHLYNKQLRNPEYRRLIDGNITIFGTFDDHDYGCNNADKTYQFKHDSSLAFVDFINQPEQSPMRIRANKGHGVYGVKLFDFSRPEGSIEVADLEAGIDVDLPILDNYQHTYSNRSVAVFVLDVRTSKTPWKKSPESYIPDKDGDFLGERQWEWFEQSIRRSKASVNVIVSGLQYHGNRFPDANIAEAWGKFPSAQQRLFDAILQDNVHAPILVSGDVHMTQLSRKDCIRRGQSSSKRPLVEITTSGMTHSWGTIASPINRISGKPTWGELYESLIGRSTMHLLHYISPWTELMVAKKSHDEETTPLENGGGEGAKDGLQYSLEKNFGELEFNWDEGSVSIRAIGEGINKPPLLMARMSIDQLSGRSEIPGESPSMSEFAKEQDYQSSQVSGDWVCVNHRGSEDPLENIFSKLASNAMFSSPSTMLPFVIFGFFVLLMLSRLGVRKQASNSQASNKIDQRMRSFSSLDC